MLRDFSVLAKLLAVVLDSLVLFVTRYTMIKAVWFLGQCYCQVAVDRHFNVITDAIINDGYSVSECAAVLRQ